MIEDIDWPRKGDIVFEAGSDWWHNACLGWSHDQWIGYAEGYKLAADLLVQHVMETRSKQDFLVYPIVFLYRQALELSLKHLIVRGSQLLDLDEELPMHHRLVHLWEKCRPMLEKVWPGGPKEDLDAVGEVIQQFKEKDPGSFAFRYPVDKAGAATFPKSEKINLRKLSEVVNRAYTFLDTSAGGISEYLQNKWATEH